MAQHLDELGERVGGVVVVVDDEDPPSFGTGVDAGGALRVCAGVMRAGERQRDHELRPAPRPLARPGDLAAVQRDEALHQREPEAEPALAARERLLRLRERLEDRRVVLRPRPDGPALIVVRRPPRNQMHKRKWRAGDSARAGPSWHPLHACDYFGTLAGKAAPARAGSCRGRRSAAGVNARYFRATFSIPPR